MKKEHLTFLAPWKWLKTLAQSARIKTVSTKKSEPFLNGTGTLKDRNSISHALISCHLLVKIFLKPLCDTAVSYDLLAF